MYCLGPSTAIEDKMHSLIQTICAISYLSSNNGDRTSLSAENGNLDIQSETTARTALFCNAERNNFITARWLCPSLALDVVVAVWQYAGQSKDHQFIAPRSLSRLWRFHSVI